jgi:murein DD-endopeptidase MepM/ murein hydrolase activator NlpD
VVQAGDSLFAIALRYNVTVDALMAANNLTNPDFVFSGQRLVIPNTAGSASSGGSGSTAPPVAASPTLQLRADQPGELNSEGVLIINDGNSPVNLQGWYLTGEVSDPVYVFQDLPLFPGGSVRLHSRAGTDDSLNLYWGRSAPIWRSGATIRLFNANGSQMATVGIP